MPRPASDALARLLEAHGPMLASDLISHLRGEDGVQADAARKRLARVRPPVLQLEHLVFPRNERFYYLEDQAGSEPYWYALLAAMGKTGSVFGHVIHAMIARGGLIPRNMFDLISGSPVERRFAGSRLTGEEILQRLVNADVVFQGTGLEGRSIVGLSRQVPFDPLHPSAIRARLLAEDIFLLALRDWLRTNGLISFDRVAVRGQDPAPEVGGYRWDLTGPSYVAPLPGRVQGRVLPGFVVGDVLFAHAVGKEQLGYFIHKASVLFNRPGSRPVLPLFVAQSFTAEALRFGREHFICVTTPANLLGEHVAKALESLIHTLENAASAAVHNPQILETLFTELGRIEGAAGRLRGALFELVVGHCVRAREGNTILLGLEVVDPSSGERVEIDVLRIKENQEVCAYECKGYGPQREVGGHEIQQWLERIPRMRGYLLAQEPYRHIAMQFAFWTTSRFSAEALDLLRQAEQARRYQISYKDGQQVLEYTRELGGRHIQRIVEQFYLRPPGVPAPRNQPPWVTV